MAVIPTDQVVVDLVLRMLLHLETSGITLDPNGASKSASHELYFPKDLLIFYFQVRIIPGINEVGRPL